MAMYTKPMPYKDFVEMMGEPAEDDLNRIKAALNKDKHPIQSNQSTKPEEA